VYGSSICSCAFGHTGWTGTMLWVDPTADLFVVFLTNRSLEPRVRNSITALRELRNRLSDEVLAITRRGDY
jgi:CubicO group peptidase (beta-lactamase class C family)